MQTAATVFSLRAWDHRFSNRQVTSAFAHQVAYGPESDLADREMSLVGTQTPRATGAGCHSTSTPPRFPRGSAEARYWGAGPPN